MDSFDHADHAMLTRDEAAKYLNIKPQTLAIWAMSGKGPAVTKLGRAVRYEMAALRAFVRQSTHMQQRDHA